MLASRKILRYMQKDGWCGPAAIQMVLVAGGIKKTQKDIARAVYKPWWGTSQQTILAYLSKFFKHLNYKENARLSDVIYHLKKRHVVIVNWWDDIDPDDEEGHYSLILNVGSKKVTLADPSQGRGIWRIDRADFRKRWYDSLDVNWEKWIEGWMLWVDPKTRITQKN